LNILSKYTAFIGVEVKTEKIKDKMELRLVPLQEVKKRESVGRCFDTRSLGVQNQKSLPLTNSDLEEECYRGSNFEDDEEEDCDDGSVSESAFFEGVPESALFRGGESVPESASLGSGHNGYFHTRSVGVKSEAREMDEEGEMEEEEEDEQQDMGFSLFNENESGDDFVVKSSAPKKVEGGGKSISEVKVKLIIKTKLLVKYSVLLGGLLTANNNGSLCDILKDYTLIIGDLITLTKESKDINATYEVVSLGSKDEPWVLRRI